MVRDVTPMKMIPRGGNMVTLRVLFTQTSAVGPSASAKHATDGGGSHRYKHLTLQIYPPDPFKCLESWYSTPITALKHAFERNMDGTSVFSTQFWVGKGMGRFFFSLDLMFGVQDGAHSHCENSDS